MHVRWQWKLCGKANDHPYWLHTNRAEHNAEAPIRSDSDEEELYWSVQEMHLMFEHERSSSHVILVKKAVLVYS